MEVFDILNEISDRGKLRNVSVGGYVKKEIPQPPIFSTEELDSDGKFVDFKVVYITVSGKRFITAGNIVVFVPKDLKVKDFYEFRGTLSLGGFDYSRLVTMMAFKKVEKEGRLKPVWQVNTVGVSDLDLARLPSKMYDIVWDFTESPLTHEHDSTKHLLTPVSELENSDKVFFNFKQMKAVRPKSNKETSEFESKNNYLIDNEYEVIREALRFPVLAVNISDFGFDKMLLEYMSWLVDGNIVFVESMSEVVDNSKYYVVLTNRDIENVPYLELRKGALEKWV